MTAETIHADTISTCVTDIPRPILNVLMPTFLAWN